MKGLLIKDFCLLKNQPRTFALRRIKKAELLEEKFMPDQAIIDSVNLDDFLGFKKISQVKLHAGNYALDRLRSSPLHSHQVIHPDGTVEIPSVSKEVLFPFILSLEGNVRILEPEDLRNEFKEKLKQMLGEGK